MIVPRHFWSIAIVTEVLPYRHSEIRRAILRMVKINAVLESSVNKLVTVKNTCHDKNQIDQVRE